MLRNVEDLRGPAGRLEALLNEGQPGAPYAALVCHPHPLFGGTMHNKVVYHAMKTLQEHGLPVLRFNFRGAGLSEGVHDRGHGEMEDARAALTWLERTYAKPILLTGFSFGASVALHAGCGDARVAGLVALGLPVTAGGRAYQYGFLAHCTQPKLFLSGDNDEYGPVAQIKEAVDGAAPPAELVVIPGADHFFVGKLDQMQSTLSRWLTQHFTR